LVRPADCQGLLLQPLPRRLMAALPPNHRLADAESVHIGLALAYHPENRSPLLKSSLISFLTTIARDNL
jgi:hypothetical protein